MSANLALFMRSTCPYCVRVTDFCQQAGIALPYRNITEGEHLEALMVGGGKRQVPCLRIETIDGQVSWLYESLDIIAFLKQQYSVPN